MTHDERIEAMARAIYLDEGGLESEWDEYRNLYYSNAEAALAAACMEAAVREAVDQACDGMLAAFASGRAGWLCGLTDDERDAIVARVMGK